MISNFFKIALRNLKKQKLYSSINIAGLSLALAVSVFGILFVTQELNFDKFHEDHDRIFRLVTVFGEEMRQEGSLSEAPSVLKSTIEGQVPEIKEMVRIKTFEVPVKRDKQSFKERIFFAGEEYFNIFSFDLIRGAKENVLDDPAEVVISKRMSEKYFGNQNPVGEILSIYFRASFHDFRVSGVVENAPPNSSIQHDFLFSYRWLVNLDSEEYDINEWAPNVFNFVKLGETSLSLSEVNAKVASVVETVRGNFLEERGFSRNALTYELRPLKDMHLSTDVRNWPNTVLLGPPPSNILYSYILISIVIVVLLIACINYTTYSIGYSIYRGKEVGVRKTLGANKAQIMTQFWLETLVLTFISLSVGVALLYQLLPALNNVLSFQLSLASLFNPLNIIILLGLWILVSLLAGAYPSVVLSGYKPQRVLKGETQVNSGSTLSKVLVGVQYVGVLILVISLVTIFKQLNHIQAKSLLDEEEQVLIIRNQQSANLAYEKSYERLRQNLKSRGYNKVTGSFGAVNDDLFMMGYQKPGEDQTHFSRAFIVDYNYLDVYKNIELISGRFFDEEYGADQNSAIVVNETFVKKMGLDNPVGSIMKTTATQIQNESVEIIGVVKDFHFESLHQPITPAVFLPIRDNIPTRYVSIEFPPSATEETLEAAREAWSEVHSDLPFEYSFLDQRYEAFYKSEQRWKNITAYATILGIIISVMGIVALTGLSANNKRKEIGIRKILGASIFDILLLLGRQFTISLAFAFLIAVPVSYYLMSRWLQNFTYATDIGILPYLLAAGLTFFITTLAFGQQAFQAATRKPVDSLRNE